MKTPQQGLESLLKEGALELGITLRPQQCAQFLTYLDLLKRWNRQVNLTAVSGDRAIIERHFLDSMVGAKAFEGSKHQRVLDLGSGPGFPGVPLKILLPEMELVLLDSSQKKAAFLHQLLGVLGLQGVRVVVARAEVFAREDSHQASFDYVVSRAFSKPAMALKQALPLVASGGSILLYAGPSGDKGLVVPEGWGFNKTEYRLPFSGTPHALLVFSR